VGCPGARASPSAGFPSLKSADSLGAGGLRGIGRSCTSLRPAPNRSTIAAPATRRVHMQPRARVPPSAGRLSFALLDQPRALGAARTVGVPPGHRRRVFPQSSSNSRLSEEFISRLRLLSVRDLPLTPTEWSSCPRSPCASGAVPDHKPTQKGIARIISQKGSPERNEVAAPGRQGRRRRGLVNSGCHDLTGG
jgi:hypothetical protein